MLTRRKWLVGLAAPALSCRLATKWINLRADFRSSFKAGEQTSKNGWQITIRVVSAGELMMPSGSLVAVEPERLGASDVQPASGRLIASGRYPATLAIADFNDGDHRVACAKVSIGRKPAVTWRMARVGDGPRAEQDGYPVLYGDGGTGCFADARALEWFRKDVSRRESTLENMFARLDKAGTLFTEQILDPATGLNVISFRTGFGDGIFPTFWGLSEGGEVVEAVTDFSITNAVSGP